MAIPLDLVAIEQALRTMRPRQQLYELVKREMQRRGRWKLRNRGASPPKKAQYQILH